MGAATVTAIGGFEISPTVPSKPGFSSRVERRHVAFDVLVSPLPQERLMLVTVAPKDNAKHPDARMVLKEAIAASSDARDEALRTMNFDPSCDLDLSLDLVDAMTRPAQTVIMGAKMKATP
jgi:hypothetical protein